MNKMISIEHVQIIKTILNICERNAQNRITMTLVYFVLHSFLNFGTNFGSLDIKSKESSLWNL